MFLYVVSYDLNNPGQAYPAIIGRLVQLGAKRIQYSQWMLKSSMSVTELRDDLRSRMDLNDRLLVVDVSNAPMAWANLEVEIKPAFDMS